MVAPLLRRICLLAILGAIQLLSIAAVAQPAESTAEPTKEELAAARQLFKEGLALEKRNKWSEALTKFQTVANVKMTPQVRFHVALCQEHLGHLVDAINGFELAEQEARRVGQEAKEVLQNAPKRAAALHERIGAVHLTVQGTVRTSKILLDGAEVSPALLGSEIPLDPGSHALEVETAGKIAFRREIQIEAGDVAELELPIDDPEPPPGSAPPKDEQPPTKDTTRPSPASHPADTGPGRWPAYVVGGVGIAAAAAGGIMWILGQQTISNINEDCLQDNAGCDPRKRADIEATAELGQNYYLSGNILVPAGGGLVAVGLVLFFVLAPDDDDPPADVAVVPTGRGLVVVGRF